MNISFYHKKKILNNFPSIKPFYEKNLHKKVDNNNRLYVLIPKGKKYFVWFTKYNGENVCMVLNYNKKHKRVDNVEIKRCYFNKILTSGKGTIFYGTLLKINDYNFFNVENIFYYKGYDLRDYDEINKWEYLEDIMRNDIIRKIYDRRSLILGLSIVSNNYNNIKTMCKSVSFNVYAIQHRNFKKNYCYYNERINNTFESYAVFKVNATLDDDMYDLFTNKGFHGKANIPDYKTSVFMNSLFRNIKENDDLDLLEMSDDEDEFEDVSIDKFLLKNKTYNIKCVYNSKYKSWVPLELSNEPIINSEKLIFLEK